MESNQTNNTEKKRGAWISLLSTAETGYLESVKKNLVPSVEYSYVLEPETGIIMAQAKADGSQSRFNLGEITVSRCVLRVKEKFLGTSWVMGSDLRHAELAALFDGLLQDPEHSAELDELLISKLEKKQKAEQDQLRRDIEETKVEFFTLKRGE